MIEKAELRGEGVYVGMVDASVQVIKGLRGGGGGMWSRHTFSLAHLEPTRTGVGLPGQQWTGS